MAWSYTEMGGMQYLMTRPMDTTDSASPQLKRSSKVLSIFVDSEDVLLEGTGDGLHLDSTNNCKQLPQACDCTIRSYNCCENVCFGTNHAQGCSSKNSSIYYYCVTFVANVFRRT